MASASASAPPNPLSAFDQLSPSTYFAPTSGAPPQGSPSLILLLAWLDATPRHLRLYLSHYQSRHPLTPICVIITNKRELLLRSAAWQRARLTPVLDVLLAHAGAVLVHSFSNAGAIQLSILAQLHARRTGAPLPLRLTVLDSAPGLPTLRRSIAALSVALPAQAVLRVLVRMLIVVGLTAWTLARMGMRVLRVGGPDAVVKARGVVNDACLVERGRRLYVYSPEDQMVGVEDVERHAREAEGKGWRVAMVKVRGSGHVAHAVKDGEGYWNAVEQNWREASEGGV